MILAEQQQKHHADEAREIEDRILDQRIENHHVLTIARLADPEHAIEQLAQYGYAVELRCLGHRDVARAAVARSADLQQRVAQQDRTIAELRELLRRVDGVRRAA